MRTQAVYDAARLGGASPAEVEYVLGASLVAARDLADLIEGEAASLARTEPRV